MKEQRQINLQISLNPENRSHMELLKWIDTQTKNRSSYIRETMVMRMMGFVGSIGNTVPSECIDLSREEAFSIIQV